MAINSPFSPADFQDELKSQMDGAPVSNFMIIV